MQRFHGRVSFAIVLMWAILLAGCGGGQGGPPAAAQTVAAEFSLPDLDGDVVKLSDLDADVRILDFWATWCAPCREEIPMYQELHAEYPPEQVRIVAISIDDEGAEVVKPFVEKYGIEYLNLIADEQVRKDYPMPGVPTTYVIDREGNVVKMFVGPKPKQALVELIDRIRSEGPAA
jgi:thiol-disulfide isomerase/thioredoxin